MRKKSNDIVSNKMEKNNFVYILRCNDNTFYTGWTNDLEKRIMNHNIKKGAKYTKNRLPAYLEYFESYSTKIEAMKREYQIKTYKRVEKEKLVNKKLKKCQIIIKNNINDNIKRLFEV